MKRGAPLERKRMKRTRTTNGAFDADTRELATARAGGLCEVCRSAPVEQHHHRLARKSGGTRNPRVSSVCNALSCCAACHLTIEMNRTWAVARGYLVVGNWQPDDVSVLVDGERWLFTLDGGKELVPDVA